MKNIIAILLFLFPLVTLRAQQANPAPVPAPAVPKTPAIGRVYGKVVDAASKEPVEYAVLTLLTLKDSVVTGSLSKSNGDFAMEKIPFGRYKLRIQFIGYTPQFIPVGIMPGNFEQDMGNITLETSSTTLKQVVVEGEKSNVSLSIDRKVYNVEKDISVKGGTGLDVMKNVPGVSVDADGGVTLRNSSPTIFVDGRPTTLTLEQIPADQIERVEVITNPSAKFDASSSGGILNVILKKSTKPGYNGTVGAGVGTNSRYNFNTNLNIKEKPFNFSFSYSLNTRANNNAGYTYRTNLSNGEPNSYFKQENLNHSSNLFHNGRIGLDYNLSNRNVITLAQSITKGTFKNDDRQTFRSQDSAMQTLFYGNRENDQLSGFENYNTQLYFRHTYPKKGKEFTTDLNFNVTNQKNTSTFSTYNYSSGSLLPDNPQIQDNQGSGSGNMITFQFDFTNPISDTTKLEWGAKSSSRLNNSVLDVSMLDYPLGAYRHDSVLSNNYRVNDIVNAAYITYSSMWGKIGYQAGLRLEQTYFTASLVDKNQKFEYLYPNGTKNLGNAFFPSLYLSRKYKNGEEVQLNFSRKIKRPGFMQMMPFILFSDKLSYQIGNPALGPEFPHIAELNYFKPFKKGSLLSSVYFKYTDRVITNYVYPLPTDSSILVSSYINGHSSWAYGSEQTLKRTFFKKLDITLNGYVFYSMISTGAGSGIGALKNSGISWNVKAIASYKLPKSFTLQVNGSYEAPRIIPQGKTKEIYFMDLSLNKDVSKHLSLNVTLSDVFNTKRWGSFYQGSTFVQDLSRRWETRYVRVSMNWRFGETDVSLFRRRAAQKREPGGGGTEPEF